MDSINNFLFINPGINIGRNDKDIKTIVNFSKEELKARWENQLGKSILSKWRANNFDRKTLDELVGKYYDHTDIRGISLVSENFADGDLSNIDFYSSNLQNTKFENVDLSKSWLSESDIRGVRFEGCKMEGVLIDNVEYNKNTTFIGIDLNTINFNLAIEQQRIDDLQDQNLELREALAQCALELATYIKVYDKSEFGYGINVPLQKAKEILGDGLDLD